jgi:hypothetical protein
MFCDLLIELSINIGCCELSKKERERKKEKFCDYN